MIGVFFPSNINLVLKAVSAEQISESFILKRKIKFEIQ